MINPYIVKFYQALIPFKYRDMIAKKRLDYEKVRQLKLLKKDILKYYSKIPKKFINKETNDVIKYLKKHRLKAFPYKFTEKYNPDNIQVFTDHDNGLKYVMCKNKRLYFKRSWNENKIKSAFSDLLIEQDIDSPHCYMTEQFKVNKGDVIIDLGCGEGNFALEVVESAEKLFLFETNPEWIEALKATFAPWKEKVNIINKFASNIKSDYTVILDNYFESEQRIDFVKIDVDGEEENVLAGMKNILTRNKLKIALCTYHKADDDKKFKNFLETLGYNVMFSYGYIIFFYDKLLAPPYLRRGLIRAYKYKH